MSEDSKTSALINVGQSKLVENAYSDILSPPSKKAGEALGTIVNIGNTVLWSIKWINGRTKIYFENNLKKYESKLEKISNDKVTEVPTEISMPILDRFTYTSNKELSDAFVKLLASASSVDTAHIAHPGFIQIIDRLSPDEALLLQYISKISGIPSLSIRYRHDPNNITKFRWLVRDATGLQTKLEGLNFYQNLNIYLNNLQSLGLIQREEFWYTLVEKECEVIKEDYRDKIEEMTIRYSKKNLHNIDIEYIREMFILSEYGKMFARACIC